MYALRERRIHVGGEDFEMAIASTSLSSTLHCLSQVEVDLTLSCCSRFFAEVLKKNSEGNTSVGKLFS